IDRVLDVYYLFFFSSRRRHTRSDRDWSSDVCSSDLEFEQMEMQFFVKPGTDLEWFDFWRQERMKWLAGLGVRPDKLRFHQHAKDELAHYAKDAYEDRKRHTSELQSRSDLVCRLLLEKKKKKKKKKKYKHNKKKR